MYNLLEVNATDAMTPKPNAEIMISTYQPSKELLVYAEHLLERQYIVMACTTSTLSWTAPFGGSKTSFTRGSIRSGASVHMEPCRTWTITGPLQLVSGMVQDVEEETLIVISGTTMLAEEASDRADDC